MNIMEKVFGLDLLCNNFGYTVGTGPEYECVPLIMLHGNYGTLVPGYTIRRYWDEEYNTNTLQSESWLDSPGQRPLEDPISIMIPFPQRISICQRSMAASARSLLVHKKSKINYLSEKNIREVDKFDFSGLDEIMEHVKVGGALSITMSNMENIRILLSGFKQGIVEKFKYCVVRYSNPGKLNAFKKYSLTLCITFIDIGMCIPIFDGDKVDGVGVMCEYIYKSPDGLDYATTGRGMTMVLSNNAENIITVDGTIIGEHSPPSRDIIKSLTAIALAEQQSTVSNDSKIEPDNIVIARSEPTLTTAYSVDSSGGYVSNTSSNYYTYTTS